jgi:heme oxygenase
MTNHWQHDIEAIRQSPRQHFDYETFKDLADAVMVLTQELERLLDDYQYKVEFDDNYDRARKVLDFYKQQECIND